MELNKRQERFCEEYLIDLNATQAALRAGYSAKTAYSSGQRLLKDVEISNYINTITDARQSDRIASVEEVMQTLTRIMRREEKESVVTTVKKRKSYFNAEGRKVSAEVEEPVITEIPTKVADVNRAAELLGKRYSLFTSNVKIEGALPVVIVDDMDDE